MSMDDLTDREALEELLARFGLTSYTGQRLDGQPDDDLAVRPGVRLPEPDEVIVVAGVGGVTGYTNFSARFTFDAEGGFKSLGIWE